MHKDMLLFIFIIFMFFSSNKSVVYNDLSQNNDKISWSINRKLKWEDYKGIPDTIKSNTEASTYSEIEVVNSYFEDGIPKYVIQCNFIKSKSWTRSFDNYTLLHEQLHFDIYELFTRKIRKSIDSLNLLKTKKQDTYKYIFEKYGKKCNNYNDLYDSQVYFDSIKQQLWVDKISKKLNELKKYESL